MDQKTSKFLNSSLTHYYKSKYHIAFYDIDDETYIVGFDTVKDICKYINKEVTSANVAKISCKIYTALHKNKGVTNLLGRKARIYLIDMSKNDE